MNPKFLTVDFESYYGPGVGFRTQTTEEYIRDPQFEVIGVAVARGDEEPVWFSGTDEEIKTWLNQFDWANSFVLAHNTKFDGAILSWRYGIKAKAWLDTLSMARGLHGIEAGGSLKALAERYGIGVKGDEVVRAEGKRRLDFNAEDLARYGAYCCNDVELTRTLFYRFTMPGLGEGFPASELKVIDVTLRMFIEPVLQLNLPLLETHLENVRDMKAKLLAAAEANKDDLMSNYKFAELLKTLNVDPPLKISNTTKKPTWAFAKTDEGMKELLEHSDPRVQALVSARLGTKSTIEETRTERFMGIALRGPLPVPIKYYAAHTGRFGGDDKINLQNLAVRGKHGGKLKSAIEAPPGYVIIDCDSAQIEARTVAWLSGQDDLVEAFALGKDVYKIMASAIYGVPVEEVTKEMRFVGKTTILGAGYGMGAAKFQAQLKTFGVDLDLAECTRIINVYRNTYKKIPALWGQGNVCLEALHGKRAASYGVVDAVQFDAEKGGFLLPSGLWQKYEGLLKRGDGEGGTEFVYQTRTGLNKIYGGKVTENICQAVARCVVAEQMVKIAKRYKVVLTVHDAVACIAREEEAKEAQAYVEECMRWRPTWAATLPLNCESGMGKSYGEC